MKSCILITYDNQDVISEAESLCEAAQYNVLFTIRENELHFTKYGISEGKMPNLEEMIEKYQPDIAIIQECEKLDSSYFPNGEYFWIGKNE